MFIFTEYKYSGIFSAYVPYFCAEIDGQWYVIDPVRKVKRRVNLTGPCKWLDGIGVWHVADDKAFIRMAVKAIDFKPFTFKEMIRGLFYWCKGELK